MRLVKCQKDEFKHELKRDETLMNDILVSFRSEASIFIISIICCVFGYTDEGIKDHGQFKKSNIKLPLSITTISNRVSVSFYRT